jgi:hypothetical protein
LITLAEDVSNPSRNFLGRSETMIEGRFSIISFTGEEDLEVDRHATSDPEIKSSDAALLSSFVEILTDNLP